MIEVRERFGGSVVALMEVEPEQISLYGCAAISPTAEEDVVASRTWSRSRTPTRRPATGSIGRYVCDPAVFDVLETPRRVGAARSS